MAIWLMAVLAAGVAVQGASADHTSPGCLHRRPAGGGPHPGLCAALQQAAAATRRCQETLQSPHSEAPAFRYRRTPLPHAAVCCHTDRVEAI